MSQVKEVKKHVVAGPATKTFEFFIQWHLTERCNLRCHHCYQGDGHIGEMTPDEVTCMGFSATGKVMRAEYGMTWNETMGGGVVTGTEVRINMGVEPDLITDSIERVRY